jgi:uncharacterized DUF497 family protein
MRFEWDENKRKANIEKHGLDFLESEKIFENSVFTITDDRYDYGEDRFFTLGVLSGRIVALSHPERNNAIRVISLRKANKYEQERYITKIANRLGET